MRGYTGEQDHEEPVDRGEEDWIFMTHVTRFPYIALLFCPGCQFGQY